MRQVLLLAVLATPAFADPPEVTNIEASLSGASWRFDVTLTHPDTGWDHYADGWRVELADGTIIGERPLAHPHVNEMPFTRSQSGISIPAGTTQVFVRARCNVDGWSDLATPYDLPVN